MKKIIFFDADGTLWYPKKTKYTEKPWWIYFDDKTKEEDPLRHLTLTPNVKTVLKKLKGHGVILVLIGQLPYPKDIANEKLERMTKHFGIFCYFDQIRASHSSIKIGEADPKNIAMLEVLKERNIPKNKALMVGDSYRFDYLAARSCGIDCVLIGSFKHTKDLKEYKRIKNKIKTLSGLLNYV